MEDRPRTPTKPRRDGEPRWYLCVDLRRADARYGQPVQARFVRGADDDIVCFRHLCDDKGLVRMRKREGSMLTTWTRPCVRLHPMIQGEPWQSDERSSCSLHAVRGFAATFVATTASSLGVLRIRNGRNSQDRLHHNRKIAVERQQLRPQLSRWKTPIKRVQHLDATKHLGVRSANLLCTHNKVTNAWLQPSTMGTQH